MLKGASAAFARFLPGPVRRQLKARVLPPVLRTIRRARTGRRDSARSRRYAVEGCETFVGYYDVQPISGDGRALLAHATTVRRSPARAGDEVQVGHFDLASGSFVPLATTTLWCWQMGARLRWWQGHGDRVLAFNAICDGQPSFCVAGDGVPKRAVCDRPLFDIAPNQEIGLALNFGRLARCRPGYGYPLLTDPFAAENLPAGDGVTLVDMASGKAELAYPLPRFATAVEGACGDQYHYLNAASLSPSGRRFSVLYLRIASLDRPDAWHVDAFVGDTSGTSLIRVPLPGRASHYWWLDDHRIAYTSVTAARSDYLVYDVSDASLTPLHPAAPAIDGHPSLNPRTDEWLTDRYPDLYAEQALYLFGASSKGCREVARFAADPRYDGEWRCDLHPRWSPQGDLAIVDSTHEGFRAVYTVELTGAG